MPDPSLRILSSAVVSETLANCSHRTDSAHSQIIVEGTLSLWPPWKHPSAGKMKIRTPEPCLFCDGCGTFLDVTVDEGGRGLPSEGAGHWDRNPLVSGGGSWPKQNASSMA
jgi:hypothetical protein